jgi:hypothetical protein
VSDDDVLFGYRLRLFTLAAEIGVRPACRAMGVHHSTYYRWKRKVDRWGLEALRVRERRRPRMPNQIGPHLEQRVIAFSLGHPGFGARRISAGLAREKWGGLRISEHGVWRVLCRYGLNTRSKRPALIARHRDPYDPGEPRDPLLPGAGRQPAEEFSPEPATLPVVRHPDSELGFVRVVARAHIPSHAEAVAGCRLDGNEGLVVVVVDVREVDEPPRRKLRGRAEEVAVARALGQALEPGGKSRLVRGAQGADLYARAVAKRNLDHRFSFAAAAWAPRRQGARSLARCAWATPMRCSCGVLQHRPARLLGHPRSGQRRPETLAGPAR